MIDKQKNKFEFIQKNYAWIATLITGFSITISYIFRFIEYVTNGYYFSYYGLDMNLYKYNDVGFIYGLCFSLIFQLLFFSSFYCCKQISEDIKNLRLNYKRIIENIVIILISGFFFIVMFGGGVKLDYIFKFLLFLVIVEFILSLFIFKKSNKQETKKIDFKNELINYIKRLPFLVLLFLLLIGFKTVGNLTINKQFKIINNEKVIVYSNNEYYLTLDCKIEKDKIIIYKGTQEKISNDNIYSVVKIFEMVELK